FYDLYRKAKEVQEREGLWELPRRGKPFNLTQHFWPQHYRPPREEKIEIPAFVRNHFDAFSLWQKAVETLARKHPSGWRFLRVINPAVGWAKYLNLPEHEVESFLEKLLPDKKQDIRKALKWSKELPFNTKETPRSYKLSEHLQKAIDYIQSRDGKAKRQELLKEVFHGQVWLLELVMRYLEKKGYIESHTEKSGGRGRPSKVYTLARPRPLECEADPSQALEPQAPHEALTDRPEPQGKVSGKNFSLYSNFPLVEREASFASLSFPGSRVVVGLKSPSILSAPSFPSTQHTKNPKTAPPDTKTVPARQTKMRPTKPRDTRTDLTHPPDTHKITPQNANQTEPKASKKLNQAHGGDGERSPERTPNGRPQSPRPESAKKARPKTQKQPVQHEFGFATAQPTKITVQEWEMRYLKALMREYRTLQKELNLLALSVDYDYEAKEWEVRDLNSKTTALKLKFTELSVEECQQRLREALYALATKDKRGGEP
ncbi:MAG: hypothetical protein RMK94_16715, partial [Armatimonadota bacterium]|nr:hypothetical protein [Armatimonadota bacterium]